MRSFLSMGIAQGLGALNVTHGLGPLGAAPPPPPPPPPPPRPRPQRGGGGSVGPGTYENLWRELEKHEKQEEKKDDNDEVDLQTTLQRFESELGIPKPELKDYEQEIEERVSTAVQVAEWMAREAGKVEGRDEAQKESRDRRRTWHFAQRAKRAPWPQRPTQVEIKTVEVPRIIIAMPTLAQPPATPPLDWRSAFVVAAAGITVGFILGMALIKQPNMLEGDEMDAGPFTYAVMFDGVDVDDFTDSLDKLTVSVTHWEVLMPHVVLVVSERSAQELYAKIIAKTPKLKKLLILDSATDRAGLLPKSSWDVIKDPEGLGDR